MDEERGEPAPAPPGSEPPAEADLPWEPPLPVEAPGPERIPKEDDPGPDA